MAKLKDLLSLLINEQTGIYNIYLRRFFEKQSPDLDIPDFDIEIIKNRIAQFNQARSLPFNDLDACREAVKELLKIGDQASQIVKEIDGELFKNINGWFCFNDLMAEFASTDLMQWFKTHSVECDAAIKKFNEISSADAWEEFKIKFWSKLESCRVKTNTPEAIKECLATEIIGMAIKIDDANGEGQISKEIILGVLGLVDYKKFFADNFRKIADTSALNEIVGLFPDSPLFEVHLLQQAIPANGLNDEQADQLRSQARFAVLKEALPSYAKLSEVQLLIGKLGDQRKEQWNNWLAKIIQKLANANKKEDLKLGVQDDAHFRQMRAEARREVLVEELPAYADWISKLPMTPETNALIIRLGNLTGDEWRKKYTNTINGLANASDVDETAAVTKELLGVVKVKPTEEEAKRMRTDARLAQLSKDLPAMVKWLEELMPSDEQMDELGKISGAGWRSYKARIYQAGIDGDQDEIREVLTEFITAIPGKKSLLFKISAAAQSAQQAGATASAVANAVTAELSRDQEEPILSSGHSIVSKKLKKEKQKITDSDDERESASTFARSPDSKPFSLQQPQENFRTDDFLLNVITEQARLLELQQLLPTLVEQDSNGWKRELQKIPSYSADAWYESKKHYVADIFDAANRLTNFDKKMLAEARLADLNMPAFTLWLKDKDIGAYDFVAGKLSEMTNDSWLAIKNVVVGALNPGVLLTGISKFEIPGFNLILKGVDRDNLLAQMLGQRRLFDLSLPALSSQIAVHPQRQEIERAIGSTTKEVWVEAVNLVTSFLAELHQHEQDKNLATVNDIVGQLLQNCNVRVSTAVNLNVRQANAIIRAACYNKLIGEANTRNLNELKILLSNHAVSIREHLAAHPKPSIREVLQALAQHEGIEDLLGVASVDITDKLVDEAKAFLKADKLDEILKNIPKPMAKLRKFLERLKGGSDVSINLDIQAKEIANVFIRSDTAEAVLGAIHHLFEDTVDMYGQDLEIAAKQAKCYQMFCEDEVIKTRPQLHQFFIEKSDTLFKALLQQQQPEQTLSNFKKVLIGKTNAIFSIVEESLKEFKDESALEFAEEIVALNALHAAIESDEVRADIKEFLAEPEIFAWLKTKLMSYVKENPARNMSGFLIDQLKEFQAAKNEQELHQMVFRLLTQKPLESYQKLQTQLEQVPPPHGMSSRLISKVMFHAENIYGINSRGRGLAVADYEQALSTVTPMLAVWLSSPGAEQFNQQAMRLLAANKTKEQMTKHLQLLYSQLAFCFKCVKKNEDVEVKSAKMVLITPGKDNLGQALNPNLVLTSEPSTEVLSDSDVKKIVADAFVQKYLSTRTPVLMQTLMELNLWEQVCSNVCTCSSRREAEALLENVITACADLKADASSADFIAAFKTTSAQAGDKKLLNEETTALTVIGLKSVPIAEVRAECFLAQCLSQYMPTLYQELLKQPAELARLQKFFNDNGPEETVQLIRAYTLVCVMDGASTIRSGGKFGLLPIFNQNLACHIESLENHKLGAAIGVDVKKDFPLLSKSTKFSDVAAKSILLEAQNWRARIAMPKPVPAEKKPSSMMSGVLSSIFSSPKPKPLEAELKAKQYFIKAMRREFVEASGTEDLVSRIQTWTVNGLSLQKKLLQQVNNLIEGLKLGYNASTAITALAEVTADLEKVLGLWSERLNFIKEKQHCCEQAIKQCEAQNIKDEKEFYDALGKTNYVLIKAIADHEQFLIGEVNNALDKLTARKSEIKTLAEKGQAVMIQANCCQAMERVNEIDLNNFPAGASQAIFLSLPMVGGGIVIRQRMEQKEKLVHEFVVMSVMFQLFDSGNCKCVLLEFPDAESKFYDQALWKLADLMIAMSDVAKFQRNDNAAKIQQPQLGNSIKNLNSAELSAAIHTRLEARNAERKDLCGVGFDIGFTPATKRPIPQGRQTYIAIANENVGELLKHEEQQFEPGQALKMQKMSELRMF